MMTRLICPLLVLLTLVVAGDATAQRQQRAPEMASDTPAGVSLDEYRAAIQAAAREAGSDALSNDEAFEQFCAADTDSNGTLDAQEVAAAERRGGDCGRNGVCRFGQCFCSASERSSGDEGGLLESDEASHSAAENPIFINPSGPNNNVLAE